MTKLIFRYSYIYDLTIAGWLGKKWQEEYAKRGFKYVKEIQAKWDKINDKVFAVFESFGFKLPDWWLAYPITRWGKVFPFSDPLTFNISQNWNDVFSTLIHELGHVELTYFENEKLTEKIFRHIERAFPNEKSDTITHIPVNLLQLSVMVKIFPKNYQEILAQEKSFPDLARAWEIIEANKERISFIDPIGSILKLSP